MTQKMPGGELATRPLHFIWICDCSGSMDGEKIHTLNAAIEEALPAMRDVAEQNAYANVLVRTLHFSSSAQWVNRDPVPVADFKWFDIEADGVTDMGKALSMVADELKIPPMEDRALPPVLVLVSDGQPTDDFESGLKKLMDQPWGKKAVRIAIAVGDADTEVLQRFIGNTEVKPLVAKNAPALVKQIKWISTAVTQAASAPASQTKDRQTPGTNVPIPTPPPDVSNPNGVDDVW